MTDPKKPTLRPANENPWYILATIHGEQEGYFIDRELAARNRETWNRYYSKALTEEEKADLRARGVASGDLVPLSGKEKASLLQTFRERIGDKAAHLPDISKSVLFYRTRFEKAVSFNRFIFPLSADFRAATFTQEAHFSDATFTKWSHFFEATFTEGAHFSKATFTQGVDFSAATFTKGAHFSRAIFMQVAYFGDAVFKGMTLFAHAQFLTHVPDLRGASLHEATEWHGALWPPVSPRDWFGYDCQRQVYAYERLKQEMERLKKHDDEVFFFAKEMRARRGLIPKVWHATWRDWLRLKPLGWLVERGFNCAYEGVSGYGRSFMRPALWMGVVWALGTALHALRPIRNGEPLPWPEAMGWSFANLFAFLPLKREMMADAANLTASGKLDLSWIAHAASGGQAVIGTLLLFLIGLGLRNRFRLR